jgi:hypothetical protein
VILADTNWDAISAARMENIPTYFGNPMSEHAERTLDISAVGRVLVISPYRQLNPLVTYHFENNLGKGTVLGLSNNEHDQRPSHQVSESYAKKLGLFAKDVNYAKLVGLVAKGAVIKNTRLSDSFSEADYDKQYNGRALRLGAISPTGKVTLYNTATTIKLAADWRIISLISPGKEPVKT